MHHSGTVIARLRVRGALRDPLAARLRLNNVLSCADIYPAGLADTAIVFIRSLRDPQPGRLRLAQVGQVSQLAWQQAVRRKIEALAQGAARPAQGVVSENAEAVWFSDRSELLACLARDWCTGVLTGRWWWRSLLRDTDSFRAVIAQWLQNVEYAPAALQQLSLTQQAHTFVQRLTQDVRLQLLERVIERFGLSPLRQVLLTDQLAENAVSKMQSHPLSDAVEGAAIAGHTARVKNLWLPWVPEVTHVTLSSTQINVLGIMLLLQRAPLVARSAVWVKTLKNIINGVVPVIPAMPLNGTQPKGEKAHADGQTGHLAHTLYSRVSTDSTLLPRVVRNSDYPSALNHTSQVTPGIISGEPTLLPINQENVSAVASPSQMHRPATRDSPTHSYEAHAANASHNMPASWEDRQDVESAYGGAMFLINLALFLELYGDFSQPARPGIELPIWDFVALVGEACIGNALRSDPLWRLLAELGMRQGDEDPGCRFQPPEEWRMPVDWLIPFAAEKKWRWHIRRGRLHVCHPAGFVVLDIAVSARKHAPVLETELGLYRAAGYCEGVVFGRAMPRRVNHALAPWIDWLLVYVHARLRAALGDRTTHTPGRLVCACPARLRVTPTHFDAYFTLAQLPIEVRLAGLDRDPGWVPAAGRYIHFHFD